MGKQSKNSSKTQNKTSKEPIGPPFAVSEAEYKDLVGQVADLSLDEIKEEWILAARYGDLDVVHAILESRRCKDNLQEVVNAQDANNGNTALHMAAANGHTEVVKVLLDKKARHSIVNHAGNTPLHWAAANAHETTVELLLKRVQDIDVLQKNNFGRSALTEGFSSENTNVVKHILEHDSAAEEKLLQGGTEVDVEDDGNEEGKDNTQESKENATDTEKSTTSTMGPQKDELVHEFDFLIGKETTKTNNNLRVRELPIPISHDPFGERPELDTTGYGIWAASLVMAHWMTASAERFNGKRLLELGAGCGVPGLAAAYYSDATKVYLTDLNPTTLDNLQYNIHLNQQRTSPSGTLWQDRLNAGPINWEDPNTWPSEKIDYIIGSDLIYQSSIVPILQKVVLGLCQGEGTFLYVAPDTESEIGRDGLAEFIQAMKETDGCELVSDQLAPKEYHANPLSNQDDDEYFLHFHEMTTASYRLFEFKINIVTN